MARTHCGKPVKSLSVLQNASFCQVGGFAMLTKFLIFPIYWFCHADKVPPFAKLVVLHACKESHESFLRCISPM